MNEKGLKIGFSVVVGTCLLVLFISQPYTIKAVRQDAATNTMTGIIFPGLSPLMPIENEKRGNDIHEISASQKNLQRTVKDLVEQGAGVESTSRLW